MNRKEWDALERVVQDQLASKFGLTRSGENNKIMNDIELEKIPETLVIKPKEDLKDIIRYIDEEFLYLRKQLVETKRDLKTNIQNTNLRIQILCILFKK